MFTAKWVIDEEYIEDFSAVPMDMMAALEYTLLYDERDLSGMVINAFTTPVELPLEVVAKMRELLLKMKEDGTID